MQHANGWRWLAVRDTACHARLRVAFSQAWRTEKNMRALCGIRVEHARTSFEYRSEYPLSAHASTHAPVGCMFEKAFVPLTDGDELMSCEFVIARDDCTRASACAAQAELIFPRKLEEGSAARSVGGAEWESVEGRGQRRERRRALRADGSVAQVLSRHC